MAEPLNAVKGSSRRNTDLIVIMIAAYVAAIAVYGIVAIGIMLVEGFAAYTHSLLPVSAAFLAMSATALWGSRKLKNGNSGCPAPPEDSAARYPG